MNRRKAIQLDAMRFAKSTQVKLDEIHYRIEQDQKRILMLNRFEKIKVWNELREIRRVFVPRYIPGEQKTMTPKQEQNDSSSKKESSSRTPISTHSDLNNNVPRLYSSKNVSKQDQRQHLTPDEGSGLNSGLRDRKQGSSTRQERKISPTSTRLKIREPVSKIASSGANEKGFVLNQNERVQKSAGPWRKTSWDVSSLRKISDDDCSRKRSNSSPPAAPESKDTSCPANSVVQEVHSTSTTEPMTPRSHSSLGQCGVQCPSNSMLSVACGYMSFKKLLRNKRQNDSFVSPRFRKQSEGDEAIASNSAFLRSKSAVVNPTTANATRQRTARSGVENPTWEETSSSDIIRRLSESSLSSAQIKDKPRTRKLSAGWSQSTDKAPAESSKRFRGSKAHIDERKLATSTSKLQIREEGEWREECKSVKKTVAWTVNDAHTMKSLTS